MVPCYTLEPADFREKRDGTRLGGMTGNAFESRWGHQEFVACGEYLGNGAAGRGGRARHGPAARLGRP
jgi:hypothetical protein